MRERVRKVLKHRSLYVYVSVVYVIREIVAKSVCSVGFNSRENYTKNGNMIIWECDLIQMPIHPAEGSFNKTQNLYT